MKIVEYRRHRINGVVVDPSFITNGSHFYNPDDQTWIAALPDSTEYYVPDSLTVLTEAELITRCQSIHTKYPYIKRIPDGGSGSYVNLTTDEVATLVTEWVSSITV